MARILSYGLACALVASSGAADTVLLANGNRFEDVIAHDEGDSVRIRFTYGDMSLPRAMVARVEKSASALEVYLAEAALLEADAETTAADWLALARRARAAGLEDGYRRALRRAAELDPYLPELAAEMRALDLVLDERRGRWVPYEERRAAARRGRESEERRLIEAQRAREAERRRLIEAIELLALAELAEELGERRRPQPPAPVVGIPVITVLGAGGGAFGWPDTEENRDTLRELERRQPGSLLPIGRASHHLRSRAVPGTRN